MKFTIDDMIEFCKSERDYHLKKAEMYHEESTNDWKQLLPDECKNSYMLGMHNGYNVAYNNMLESLVKLKEQSDEKKD